jgi:hypothetical protein
VDDSESDKEMGEPKWKRRAGRKQKQTGRTDSERTPRGRMKGDDEGREKRRKRDQDDRMEMSRCDSIFLILFNDEMKLRMKIKKGG